MINTLELTDIEWDDNLVGFVITLIDNRIIQIQYELQTNRLHGDFGTHFAHIDKVNDYGLDLSDDEEEFIKDYIKHNKEIIRKGIELDKQIESNN
jgi:hypothetical protein